jgi:NADPH2:quinone reductase
MRAVQVPAFGDADVLEHVELPAPVPGESEVLVRVTSAGVNFTDTRLRRMGMQTTVDGGGAPKRLQADELPVVPGGEVVGFEEPGGRRVVALCGSGGYAEQATAPASRVFEVPDGVDDATALALFVQGLTAWHLLHGSVRLQRGESVVVHSAAGGVGSLAVQLARRIGAGRIVATASSDAKRRLALQLGATAAVDGTADGLTDRLLEANDGRPVDAVLDMAGGAIFDASFAALAPLGRLAAYGTSSGGPGTVETVRLMAGSRSVVGFWLLDYLRDRAGTEAALGSLFSMAARGELRAIVGGTYPLERAADAHRALESRATSGKLVLSV